mmetsp:Transcript_31285/g.87740  ORF Transcript_31285/g.87740 Transcript_31285/m.87740 type:complete len:225 (-) Transcript_31285:458-1132(-)
MYCCCWDATPAAGAPNCCWARTCCSARKERMDSSLAIRTATSSSSWWVSSSISSCSSICDRASYSSRWPCVAIWQQQHMKANAAKSPKAPTMATFTARDRGPRRRTACCTETGGSPPSSAHSGSSGCKSSMGSGACSSWLPWPSVCWWCSSWCSPWCSPWCPSLWPPWWCSIVPSSFAGPTAHASSGLGLPQMAEMAMVTAVTLPLVTKTRPDTGTSNAWLLHP